MQQNHNKSYPKHTNETLSLLQLSELFCHFSFTFLLIISSPLLYITLRGTILVYLQSSSKVLGRMPFFTSSFPSSPRP